MSTIPTVVASASTNPTNASCHHACDAAIPDSDGAVWAQTALLLIVGALCALTHILPIVAVAKRPVLKTPAFLILTSLSANQLLQLVTGVAAALTVLLKGECSPPPAWCEAQGILWGSCSLCLLLLVATFAAERWMFVCRPIWHRKVMRWPFAIFLTTICLLGPRLVPIATHLSHPGHDVCHKATLICMPHDHGSLLDLNQAMSVAKLVGILFCLFVSYACLAHILVVARKHVKEFNKNNPNKKKRSVPNMIVCIVFFHHMTLLCFVLMNILHYVDFLNDSDGGVFFGRASFYGFMIMPAIATPVTYLMGKRTFFQELKTALNIKNKTSASKRNTDLRTSVTSSSVVKPLRKDVSSGFFEIAKAASAVITGPAQAWPSNKGNTLPPIDHPASKSLADQDPNTPKPIDPKDLSTKGRKSRPNSGLSRGKVLPAIDKSDLIMDDDAPKSPSICDPSFFAASSTLVDHAAPTGSSDPASRSEEGGRHGRGGHRHTAQVVPGTPEPTDDKVYFV